MDDIYELAHEARHRALSLQEVANLAEKIYTAHPDRGPIQAFDMSITFVTLKEQFLYEEEE